MCIQSWHQELRRMSWADRHLFWRQLQTREHAAFAKEPTMSYDIAYNLEDAANGENLRVDRHVIGSLSEEGPRGAAKQQGSVSLRVWGATLKRDTVHFLRTRCERKLFKKKGMLRGMVPHTSVLGTRFRPSLQSPVISFEVHAELV